MKTMMKKVTALVLVLMMALSFSGCSKRKDNEVVSSNGGKPVEIAYWHAGMGEEFLEKMVKTFNEKQSEWFVYYKASADASSLTAAFGQEDIDTTE